MDREGIKEVLREVFGANFPVKDVGGWVSTTCLTAQYTHTSGHDARPSAGVSVNDNGTSVYSCFTCQTPIPFHVILKRYAEFSGEDLGDLVKEIADEEYLGVRTLPDWETLKASNVTEPQMPINEGIFMDLYDSAAGHPYLRKRGISEATASKLELMFDPRDPADGEARILFPVRGYDGLLYGFSGRAIRDTAKLKVRDYQSLKKAHNVLGAHLVAQDNPDKVLVVEGLFDMAMMHEHGYHGCAIMHASMTDAQADIFRTMAKPTYLFLDNPEIDEAGARGVEIAGRKLQKYVPVMRVRYPKVQIEDDSEQGWHWIKDPGDMEKQDVEGMLDDARLF